MIKKIFVITGICALGALLGLLIVVHELGNDVQVKNHIQEYVINQLKCDLGCTLTGTLTSMNLLRGRLVFGQAHAQDTQKLWEWSAARITAVISLWQLLVHQRLSLSIIIEELKAHTQITDKKVEITDHVKKWIDMPEGPIKTDLRSLRVVSGVVSARAPKTGHEFFCLLNVDLAIKSDRAQLGIALAGARGAYSGQTIIDALHGAIEVDILRRDKSYAVSTALSGVMPLLKNEEVVVAGKLDSGMSGFFSVSTGDGLLDATVDVRNGHVISGGKISCSLINAFEFMKQPLPITGMCDITMQTKIDALDRCFGTLVLNDLTYHMKKMPQAHAFYTVQGAQVKADCSLAYENYGCHGNITYNHDTANGSVNLTNSTPIKTSFCSWQPDALKVSCDYSQAQSSIAGRIESPQGKGTFEANLTGAHLKLHDEKTYAIDLYAENDPSWFIKSCAIVLGAETFHFDGSRSNVFHTDIKLGTIRDFVKKVSGVDIDTQSVVSLDGTISREGVGTFEASLKKGTIRVPHSYNIIERCSLNGSFDIKKRLITFKSIECVLNKGSIGIKEASFAFDEFFKPTFVHVPLVFNECFIHWKKDLMGLVSGYLIVQEDSVRLPKTKKCEGASHQLEHGPMVHGPTGNKPRISGRLVVHEMHLNHNIFSTTFEKDFSQSMIKPFSWPDYDAALEVTVTSQSPVVVKTKFLDAQLSLNVSLKGTLSQPQLFGTLTVMQGTLNFPYQPLHITTGRVYFLAHQLEDPLIEITAKNKIKKYAITMNVTGSIKQPKILFDASPPLTQGQIITLLLGGAEDGSLFLAMPVSLTNTVENLLFGPAEATSSVQRSIHNLFKPLKNVRIVPRFSDESGRGGIRGSLMIEVNDNLRAIIQNNFNLTEDTRIEVEYNLSDDMVIRGVKDERGDLGAEIEKTWKFG